MCSPGFKGNQGDKNPGSLSQLMQITASHRYFLHAEPFLIFGNRFSIRESAATLRLSVLLHQLTSRDQATSVY